MNASKMDRLFLVAMSAVLCVGLMPPFAFATGGNTSDAGGATAEVPVDNRSDKSDGSGALEDNEGESGPVPSISDVPDGVGGSQKEPTAGSEDIESIASDTATGFDEEAQVLDELAASSDIAPGTYYLCSALNMRHVLDVSNGSKSNSANVQLWSSNTTAAQRWEVQVGPDGYAVFINVGSGKALDVSGAAKKTGTNIQQYTPNGSVAQKWFIDGNASDGYKIKSALGGNLVLDLYGASTADGANIQLYGDNGTKAQRWFFRDDAPSPSSGSQVITPGAYRIALSVDSSKCADVADGSMSSGANLQTWSSNGTQAQIFQFEWDPETSCYKIVGLGSGNVLDAEVANPIPGTNVWMYSSNNTNAQRWAASSNSDGSVSLVNRATGTALSVGEGVVGNGSNLFLSQVDASSVLQHFSVVPVSLISDGIYSIWSQVAGDRCLDVPNSSWVNNTQLHTWNGNGTLAQKFVFKRVEDNTYQIRALASGQYLADAGNKVVQTSTDGVAAQWIVSYEGGGIVFTNKASGMVMDVLGASTSPGTAIQTYGANKSKAQRFWVTTTDPLPASGNYELAPNCALGNRLDVAGASWQSGANVQVYAANGSNAQRWEITSMGSGTYRITSSLTWRDLDVAGANGSNGANVQVYQRNNSAAQRWSVKVTDDGWFMFVNVATGTVLDTAGASSSSGANAQAWANNGSAAQKWLLKPVGAASISDNYELDTYLRNTIYSVGTDGDTLYRCYGWVCGRSWINDAGPRYWGIMSDGDTIDRALYMFRNGYGDCYNYAATMMWLARALGYSANTRAGAVPSASQGQAAHGWTEIYLDGSTYICDANLQHDYPSRNWFLITYSNAPTEYYQ